MVRSHVHKRAARVAALCTLVLCTASAAVWTAPRVSASARAWMSTPRVELRSAVLPAALPVAAASAPAGRAAPAAGGESAPVEPGPGGTPEAAAAVTVDAGMKFTMAGLTCTPPSRAGGVTVLLRTSEDGNLWSRWYACDLEIASDADGPARAFIEAVWTGPGRYLQVAARAGGADAAPALLRDVRLVAINSSEDAGVAAAVTGVVRRAAATVAGLDLAPPAAAMTTRPPIVTRSEWGANESWRSGDPSYATVQVAFVHHTASGNGYSAADAPAIVRGVYAYHTKSLGWSDIGYNFLIDRYGVVYEGRHGGITRGVVGAQVLGFNTGSTGISVIGTFSAAAPPAAVVTSLRRLLTWKLDVHHIDPQGTGTLVCGYGQKFATGRRVTFPAIAGHRDANYTDCPGGRLYAQLPGVRNVVARSGHPKIYGFAVGPSSFSPNGDGARDKVAIGFTTSQETAWTLEVRDQTGLLVRRIEGAGSAVATTWAGRDDSGEPLPDGAYEVQADATSADGAARPATATVRVDTAAPEVQSGGASPDPFSPNGDGQNDTTTLSYTTAEGVAARLSVVDAAGAVLRRVTGWRSVPAGAGRVSWDGRVGAGSELQPASEGPVTLLLEARDAAGNTTRLRREVVVDRTLKLKGISRRAFSPDGDGVGDEVTLSYRLTRAADVVATITRDGSTQRTYRLGRLGAGARSLTWDGELGGGGGATSGRSSIKLTADGALGVSSVARAVTVDLTSPRLSAPLTARVAYGRTAKLAYTVKDAYSPTVKVRATVTDAAGRTVATLAPGWVKQGLAHTCAWKPPRRGAYTVTFRAVDLAGNRQAAPAVTTLRVR